MFLKKTRSAENTKIPRVPTFLFLAEGCLLAGAADLLFYRNLPAFFLLLLFLPFYVRLRKKEAEEERRKRLRGDFREVLRAMAVSFRAGRAQEAAFADTEEALSETLGRNHPLTAAFSDMNRRIALNIPPSALLTDFAAKSGVEEILSFAEVFETVTKCGGDPARIMNDCADQIEKRICAEQEIDTAVTAKRLEQKILCLMPAVIIAFLSLSSPGFMSVLYGNTAGICIMTGCLLLYLFSWYLGRRIAAIEV